MTTRALLVATLLLGCAASAFADGALDPTFGGNTGTMGKLVLPPGNGNHVGWTSAAVAVQSTGKTIIAGSADAPQALCVLIRLNVNGSLDTTFGGGNGLPPGYAGFGECAASGVAVRADDSIIFASTGVGYAVTPGFVTHFSASGIQDLGFGPDGEGGVVMLMPDPGDTALKLGQIVLDSGANIIAAGRYTHANSDNDFYIARVAPDGKTFSTARYGFTGSPDNQAGGSDVAFGADGSYYVAGYAKSLAGFTDCAVVHFRYQNGSLAPYATFGQPAAAGLAINTSPFGNQYDECPTIAVRRSGTLLLGGRGTYVSGSTTWNVATMVTQPADGSIANRATVRFNYDNLPGVSGDVNRIVKALIDPYGTRPLMIGSGPNHAPGPGSGTGYDMGVLRTTGPTDSDPTFGSNGLAMYDVGSTLYEVNRNAVGSAILWHGSLTIVGTAQDPLGGTNIAVVRLARFDGIFQDGAETP